MATKVNQQTPGATGLMKALQDFQAAIDAGGDTAKMSAQFNALPEDVRWRPTDQIIEAIFTAVAPKPPEKPKTATSSTVYVPPVSTTAMTASANVTPSSQGGSPAAAGFDLFERSFDMLLRAETARMASIDQALSIAQLLTELERQSPTRAADLAVALGLPELQPNLTAGNRLVNDRTSGFFGGTVGTQDVRLPYSFSGRELSMISRSEETARLFADISDRFGLGDPFARSEAGLLPTSRGLLALAGA